MISNSSTSPPSRRSRWQTGAIWCVGLGLLANAAALFLRNGPAQYPSDITFTQAANAQPMPGMGGGPGAPTEAMVGARGVYVMPAQLGPNAFGLYLLDLDAGNIVVYKALPDMNRFHLMAARNFRNDRFLEDFNNDSPTPKDVQKLIQQQRQRQDLESHGDTPTAGGTPTLPPPTPGQ